MKIRRKTVQILELTKAEADQVLDAIAKARDGHTVTSHYSEIQTGAGQFFGVSVNDPEPETKDNGLGTGPDRYKDKVMMTAKPTWLE